MEFGNNQMDEQMLGVWLRQYPSPLPECEHLPSKKGPDIFGSFSHNSSTAHSLTNFEDKCISTVESVWEFSQSAPLQI